MLRPVVISAFIFLLLAVSYIFFFKKNDQNTQSPAVPDIEEMVQTQPNRPIENINATDEQYAPGTINYDLPESWELVEENETNQNYQVLAFTTPQEGYFSITTYEYANEDPKEMFCNTYQGACVESSTFGTVQIGNLHAYQPKSLEIYGNILIYYGVHNNKFHLIEISNPNDSAEFVQEYKNVLNSLIFY